MFDNPEFPFASEMSLGSIASSHTLRCDAKQVDPKFAELDALLARRSCFYLGDVLPTPVVKGTQPRYLDDQSGVPVVNTLSIQNLQIFPESCRHISEEDFEQISAHRRLAKGDVLLTVDGGTSIGKPVLFTFDDDYTIDSHVAILRPDGISPEALVYLLASPIGQVQFLRAESGASGQTAVTEDDLRWFRFPVIEEERLDEIVEEMRNEQLAIQESRRQLDQREESAWERFSLNLVGDD